MTKELELWYRIVEYLKSTSQDIRVKETQEYDDGYIESFEGYPISIIEKSLKALEIIKEKGCLQFCMLGVSLEDYNKSVDIVNNKEYGGIEKYKHYTQEELDLLKEVLLFELPSKFIQQENKKMSKELEALKTIIGAIAYVDLRDLDRESIDKSLETIETALKRLDMYDNVVGIERIQDTNKKLKALEIIKRELKYNVDFVGISDFRAYIDGMICCENKEEYDLLKEVLL